MFGVYVGIVTDNKDADGKYRVKVRIPSQENGAASGENTFWYRVTTFGAGKDRGMYNLPEVDDEVLVAFEHGEISHGYVIGSLWNNKQTVIDDNKDGKNDDRWYKSRAGSILKFSDKDTTSVELKSAKGHQVFLDDGGKILIQHSSGNTKITLLSEDIKIESTGDTLVDCKNFKVNAKANVELTANTDVKITASTGNITGRGQVNVDFNAVTGEGKYTSTGTMTIK